MKVRTLEEGSRLAATATALLALALAFLALAWYPARAGEAKPRPSGAAATSNVTGRGAERMRSILREHALHTLDGRTLSLGSLQGEVVVVNFWASWCAPCRRELPRLDALHGEISKQGGRVVAVSIDQDLRNVERFARRHGLKLPICHDGPGGLARELQLDHVPFTLVLDRAGNVAYTARAADDHAIDALVGAARQLIAGQPVESPSAEGGIR